MKKLVSLIMVAVLLLLLVCTGCGSAKMNQAADAMAGNGVAERPGEAPAGEVNNLGSNSASDVPNVSDVILTTATAGEASGSGLESDKIIYSAYAEVETRSFDESVAAVQALVKRYGGFLESSSVTGTDYYRNSYTGRSARFVLRIPRQHFSEMTDSLSDLGNVPYYESYAKNITPEYSDTSSRLNSLRVEEERLFVMLEKAATVEEMLSIEARLSEVRYEIERLTSTIQNWDSLINYSTLELYIHEVEDYTEEPLTQRTYWQQVGDDFRRSLQNVGDFFLGIFRFILSELPMLVLLAAIAVPVVILLRRFIHKRRQPKE